MAGIFRPTYTVVDKRGKRIRKRSRIWWIRYRDENKKLVRESAYADRQASQYLLGQRMAEVAAIQRGERSRAGDASQPVAELIDAFRLHLQSRANTIGHVEKTCRMATAIVEGIGAKKVHDITAEKVAAWLSALRAKGKSTTTSNHYCRAAKSFTRWVSIHRGLPDQLASLSLMSTETDRRRRRRALSQTEFDKLVRKTRASRAVIFSLTGADRAILYQLAALTGLRLGELQSLTRESFALAATPATVTVDASHSKRRRHDVQPIPTKFVPALTKWLRGKPANRRLFHQFQNMRAAEMLAVDLERAGIPAVKDGCVFDFHALRSQFITGLARAGVPLAAAQKLARHSTPVLTAKAYTHLELSDLAAEVDKL